MAQLRQAAQTDTNSIVQVFLGDCARYPDELKAQLQDRQAIIQHENSGQAFNGKIREALRDFGCFLSHPRGFDVKAIKKGVEIIKFKPTGFPEVIIPETFFDLPLPVVSIGKKAFSSYDDNKRFSRISSYQSPTRIVLPESLERIDEFAFEGCRFTYIKVPDNVRTIGARAFQKCNSSTAVTIVLPKNFLHGWQLFWFCHSINVVIPDGVEKVPDHGFSYCGKVNIFVSGSANRGYFAGYSIGNVTYHALDGSYFAQWFPALWLKKGEYTSVEEKGGEWRAVYVEEGEWRLPPIREKIKVQLKLYSPEEWDPLRIIENLKAEAEKKQNEDQQG
jgi:hypothetical protein